MSALSFKDSFISLHRKVSNESDIPLSSLEDYDKSNSELFDLFIKCYETWVLNDIKDKYLDSHRIADVKEFYYKIRNIIAKRRQEIMLKKLQLKYSFLVKRLGALCERIKSTVNQMLLDDLNYERNNIRITFDLIKSIGLQRIELGESDDAVINEEINVDQTVTSTLRVMFDVRKNQAQIIEECPS